MSLCPNFYDNENPICKKCEFQPECIEDCESYQYKHPEDFPQIMLDV